MRYYALCVILVVASCSGLKRTKVEQTCTVVQNPDGSATISCPDGSTVNVAPGAAGSPGSSCSVVDNGDGSKTISCDDGTTITVNDGESPAGCTIQGNSDGTSTISCADGTSFTFPADEVGQISGVAQLFGRDDHAGITATLNGTTLTTQTDSEGRYSFADVAAGLYAMTFEKSPYWREQVDDVVVLNGTWYSPTVVLKLGRPLDLGRGRRLAAVHPSGDEVLVMKDLDSGDYVGEMMMWESGGGSLTSMGLAVNRRSATYSPTGTKLVWLDDPVPFSGGELYILDRASGVKTHLGSGGAGGSARFSNDESTLYFVENNVWMNGDLVAWDVASSTKRFVATDVHNIRPYVSDDGTKLAFFRSYNGLYTADIMLWDVPSWQGTTIGTGAGMAMQITPDWQHLVYSEAPIAGHEVAIWDTAIGTKTTLSTYYYGYLTMNPPGDAVAYVERISSSEEYQVLWDIATGTRTELSTGRRPSYSFSPDGQSIAFSRATPSFTWDVVVRGLATGTESVLSVEGCIDGPRYSPDGKWLEYSTGCNFSSGDLVLHELATGRDVPVAESVRKSSVRFSPNSGTAIYDTYDLELQRWVRNIWDIGTESARRLTDTTYSWYTPNGEKVVYRTWSPDYPALSGLALWDTVAKEEIPIEESFFITATYRDIIVRDDWVAYVVDTLEYPNSERNGAYLARYP